VLATKDSIFQPIRGKEELENLLEIVKNAINCYKKEIHTRAEMSFDDKIENTLLFNYIKYLKQNKKIIKNILTKIN